MEFFQALLVDLVIAAIILAAGWYGGNFASKTVKNINKLDATLKSFLGGMAKYAIFAVAVVSVLTQFGFAASMIAVLGAAGLAIGLAMQGTLSSVSAGVMLLILRPFKVGDFIVAAGVSGTVKELGLFGTELATPDNVYIYVPNAQLWNTDIQNFSRHDTRRQDLVFGISYADDINKAFKTIQAVVKKEKRILSDEGHEPQIMVTNLGESSVDITARIWSASSDYWGLQFDLKKAVKEALDKDGITIPFPTQTIEYANDAPASASKKKAA